MIQFYNANTRLIVLVVALLATTGAFGQGFLNKTVSVSANTQSIAQVLKTVSAQGGFYFSYSSTILPGDSVVSISYKAITVRDVLDKLLGDGYQYKETGTYLIIQRKSADKYLIVSGYITDQETGSPADFVSVYSKTRLVSDLTNESGYFKLKFKDGSLPLSISVSKVGYGDTTVIVNSASEVRIGLISKPVELDPVWVRYSEAERTWLGRLFVSDKLRLQSRNIGKFFVSLPYQASLTPGLSTHGMMNSQIENKISLNLIGGYSGGVNGVELAGMFNITKRSVRYVQIAGWFNVTSGDVRGVQAAGIYNHVLDSLQGVQVASTANVLLKNMHGAQIGGILNIGGGDIDGVQVAGAANVAKGRGRGAQISAIFNHIDSSFRGVQITAAVNSASGTVHGAQISSLFNTSRRMEGLQLSFINRTRNLKGAQIGLINYADSSSGVSIGLINIVRHGTSNISLYANEIAPVNLAWKMGNRKMYTMILGGAGVSADHKVYTLGFGIGKEFKMSKLLGLQAEVTSQSLIRGSFTDTGGLLRTQMSLAFWLSERFSLFVGPAFSIYYNGNSEVAAGYKTFPPSYLNAVPIGDKATGWIGAQAGLSWRYGKK